MLKFATKNNKQRKSSDSKEFSLLCWKVIKLLLINKQYQKTSNTLVFVQRYFSYIIHLSKLSPDNKQIISLSKIRNVCFLSGRTRSIYRMFKLSRLKVKELAQTAQFTGLSKLS
jgi:ribosomal protein S14